MDNSNIPSFENAVVKLVDFLRENKKPIDIEWIFSDDVTSSRQKLWFRHPIPSENTDLTRLLYERAIAFDKGVLFYVLCSSNNKSYCYIQFIEDEEYDDRCNISGLTLRIRDVPFRIMNLKYSKFIWFLRKTFNSAEGWDGAVNMIYSRKYAHNKSASADGGASAPSRR